MFRPWSPFCFAVGLMHSLLLKEYPIYQDYVLRKPCKLQATLHLSDAP